MAISGDSMPTRALGGARPALVSDPALSRGTVVDRYMVIEPMGSGGMGVVYRAYDSDLDRQVALKLLRPDIATRDRSTGGTDRLIREAQALARLSHPNVVTIYDVGTFGDQVFLAMELVEGTTLAEYLVESERAWQDTLPVFLAAGRGLAAAHAANLVHRDFKPNNVLIGADGRVRVVDFGLARRHGTDDPPRRAELAAQAEPSPLDRSLTQSGAAIGTPAYMAPEQHMRTGVDVRSDQFAFCVALYEALYGLRPFTGETEAELKTNVVEGRLTALEPQRATSRGIPVWLRRVVLRGLKPDPADRFPTMEALLVALADDPSVKRRRRVLVSGVVVMFAGGLVAASQIGRDETTCEGADTKLAGIWDQTRKHDIESAFGAIDKPFAAAAWDGTREALDRYAKRWVETHREACEATRVRGDQSEDLMDLRISCLQQHLAEARALTDLFVRADAQIVEQAVAAAHDLTPLDTCSDAEALMASVPPPSSPAVAATVETLREELTRAKELGDAGKDTDALAQAKATLARATETDYAPLHAEAHLLIAQLEHALGKADPAETSALEALWAAERAGYDELSFRAWTLLVSVVGYLQARHALGLQYGRHAESVLERLDAPPRLQAALFHNMGTVLESSGDPKRAVELHERALEIWIREYGPDDLHVGETLNGLGVDAHVLGNDDAAIQYFERALEVYRGAFGPDHPNVSTPLSNIGSVLLARGPAQAAQARHYLEQAKAIRERAHGPNHPDVAGDFNNIGVTYQVEQRYEEARRMFEQALEIHEAVSEPDHPDVGGVYTNLGIIARAQDEFELGLEHHRRALEIHQKRLEPDHVDLGYDLSGIGHALVELGRPDEAIASLERALAIRVAKDPDPLHRADVHFYLARALWDAASDRSRARSLAGRALELYASVGDRSSSEQAAVAAWLRKRRE